MKIPAVAIAAFFACGIVIGAYPPVAHFASWHKSLAGGFIIATLLILCGIVLAVRGHVRFGAAASLLSWVLLGVLGAWIGEQPPPADHAGKLIAEHSIDPHTPLRWHGTLRDEPARVPWGWSYEVALSGVQTRRSVMPVQGGLRLSFTEHPNESDLPALHAGDEVVFLTQARLPQVFRDDGAFDRRAYLANQGIDLVANLRAPQLLERTAVGHAGLTTAIPRARRALHDEVNALFGVRPQVADVLSAMLLGDRTFVDRDESTDFQKTGTFHVLVVAGLHVGALAVLLFWAARKLRLSPVWTILFTLALLFAYVAMVEQRPPVLRAAIMTAIVVVGGFFYRRLDLLNSAGVAALLLLIWRPLAIRDSSFQLTFVAIGCIAGIAVPWLDETVQPYARALRGWRDVTRDVAHKPKVIQFRIDLRSLMAWASRHAPKRIARPFEDTLVGTVGVGFRACELLALTIVLQLGMLPLMASDFHRIALAAPLTNLAAVPLVGVMVPLGFLTVGTGTISPTLGKLLAAPLAWLTIGLLHVVQWFAYFPRWSYRIPGPPWLLTIVFFLATIVLIAAMRTQNRHRHRFVFGSCGILVACSILIATYPFAPRLATGKLEVTILDVGQGDSLFVASPKGRTMLIDGGGAFGGFPGSEQHNGIDPGEEVVSPYLWSRGMKRLDVVALTHAHQDHLGGLTAILQNFRVGELWIGRDVATPALVKLEELARAENVPVKHQMRGQKFAWDGAQGEVLWPEASDGGAAFAAKNNDSLVIRLAFGERHFLLPGDAEKEPERAMLEDDRGELQSDVLKVGHHGSKNSTTTEFLSAVNPAVAVISAGEDNPYGHPNPELIERLDNAAVHILRTDRDGAVHVLTDGHAMEITCFIPCMDINGTALVRAQTPDREKKAQQK